MASYANTLPLPEALSRHFENSGFAGDGGYADPWVKLKVGPIPLAFPNFAARRRVVRYHDVHHVLTGYDTDWSGEFEISAWEIASGCAHHWPAWMINLGALAAGALLRPRRTFRAWRWGRRCRNLYREPYEPLLDETVGALRLRTLAEAPTEATLGDCASFAMWTAIGMAIGVLELAVPLAAVAGLAWWFAS